MKLSLTFGKRLWLLALLMILGLMLTVGFQFVIMRLEIPAEAMLRIISMVQQLLAFLIPAVVAAMFSARLPAELLGVRRAPSVSALLIALATLVCSIPAMTALEQLCGQIPWPESVLASEAENQRLMTLMMSGPGAIQTLLALCIMAVMPALCEELFFRGALINLLRSRPMSIHAAIWISAMVFSLMHAQPIGFVPRMLLGAAFGYFAYWGRSLWVAVAAHFLNNSAVVITQRAGIDNACLDMSTPALAVGSVLLTAGGLWLLWKDHSRSISRGI